MELTTLISVTYARALLQLRLHSAILTSPSAPHRVTLLELGIPALSLDTLTQLQHTVGQQLEYELFDDQTVELYLNYAGDPIELTVKTAQVHAVLPTFDDFTAAYRRLAQRYQAVETNHQILKNGYRELEAHAIQGLERISHKHALLDELHPRQTLRIEGEIQAYQYMLQFIERVNQEVADKDVPLL